MKHYLFGPVPSRRMGVSLGVDLVPPKTCQLNCVYCECGGTTHLTLERKEYVSCQRVTEELDDNLQRHPAPEYVTFSGAGEPTLNSGIGRLITHIKRHFPQQRIAVLTNGVSLSEPEVREALLGAHVVAPSLDAATRPAFLKVNRPHRRLSLDAIIDGMIRFRAEFSGQIWLEVFIIPGANDTPRELEALRAAIEKIEPDRVQLNTLDRPGAVSSPRAATRDELESVLDRWTLDNAEIIARAPRCEIASYRDDVESAILQTLARRPLTLADLSEMLGLHRNEINKYLDALEAVDRIQPVAQDRGVFYRRKP